MIRSAIRLFVITATLLAGGNAWGQTTYQWNATDGSTAWFTPDSWTPNVSANQWATNDTARFLNTGTATSSGINMNTVGGSFSIGGIEVTSDRTRELTIGNSSTTVAGTLTLNGATINGVANTVLRNASGQDFTVQDTQGPGTQTMNLAFANATRNVIAVDGAGSLVIKSAITGAAAGLTLTGSGTGGVDITNDANTFTGGITITGGEARFTTNGAFGNANNAITLDGGQLGTATFTLAATHGLFVGDTAGTAVGVGGGATLTYNGVIADIAGKTGSWAKQGAGTLVLGGVGTYSGATAITNGTLQLADGNDRLPTGTTVNLGLAGGATVGTLDLNGQNQTVAGLNSVAGTNSGPNRNTVTGTAAATLTLGGSGTYTFGDGTAANSGVLTGALSLSKTGTGTQILGGANTYTGGTKVNAGVLQFNGSSASFGGNASTGSMGVNVGGTVATGYALDQATLTRINSTSNGVVALAVNSTNNLNMSGFGGQLSLGAVGGTIAAPVVFSGTLTPNATTYRLGGGGGVLQVTSALTGTQALTVGRNGTVAGTVILSAANTYTGETKVQAGTLLVNGSIGTGAVTVAGTTTLGGTGTVGGAVLVKTGGTIRGGFAGGTAAQATGTLHLANTTLNNSTVSGGTGGATLAVDLNQNANPSTAAGSNSLLAFGSNTFNLDSTPGKFNISLLNDGALTGGSSYTINLASGSNFQRNGGAANFTTADFNLTSGSGAWAFNNVSLAVSGSNLQLSFQVAPVPEPVAVLTVAAAGLGVVTWVRRRGKAAAV